MNCKPVVRYVSSTLQVAIITIMAGGTVIHAVFSEYPHRAAAHRVEPPAPSHHVPHGVQPNPHQFVMQSVSGVTTASATPTAGWFDGSMPWEL